MVLGKLPVPDTAGQGATALAVCAGGGCLDIFTLIYPFSPLSSFSPSLRCGWGLFGHFYSPLSSLSSFSLSVGDSPI